MFGEDTVHVILGQVMHKLSQNPESVPEFVKLRINQINVVLVNGNTVITFDKVRMYSNYKDKLFFIILY